MRSFDEYYAYYLTLHANPMCKLLHCFGQAVTLLFVAYAIVFNSYELLLLAPIIVYPFAWTGHALFEKNTPAAWSHPLWAKRADIRMFKDLLLGNIKL